MRLNVKGRLLDQILIQYRDFLVVFWKVNVNCSMRSCPTSRIIWLSMKKKHKKPTSVFVVNLTGIAAEFFEDGEAVWRRCKGVDSCVSCGEELTYSVTDGKAYQNHHCSNRHEGSKQGASTRAETPRDRSQPLWERLYDGFKMIESSE